MWRHYLALATFVVDDAILALERRVRDAVTLEHRPDEALDPLRQHRILALNHDVRLERPLRLVELPDMQVVHIGDTLDRIRGPVPGLSGMNPEITIKSGVLYLRSIQE